MNYIVEMPWIQIVILGFFIIGLTVALGCWLEKAINEVLSVGHDEHEDNSIG